MFGLELGTLVIILLNAAGLITFIVRAEQLTKMNAIDLIDTQKQIDKLNDAFNMFKLEAAHKYASRDNMKEIKDEIAFEIRRLGDRLDKVFDVMQSKNTGHKDS